MIKIDKGVEIPQRLHGGRPSKYPWEDMQIGDSFFTVTPIKTMSCSVTVRKRRHGGKYTCRAVTENGLQGTRVWRIE